jgi:hypothetical protein
VNDYDNSPTRQAGVAIAVGLVVVGVIALIGFVGWLAGWWFRSENVQREDKVYDESYGRQEALKANIVKNIGTVNDITVDLTALDETTDAEQVAAFRAQRRAIVVSICVDANKLNERNPMPSDTEAWLEENCEFGNIKPRSEFNVR